MHGDGSAPNNSTSEKYVQKGTGGHLGFRITKNQGQENVISSNWHRMWFHWPTKHQKPSTDHHFKPNNWKFMQNCLWRPFWILDLLDTRSKFYNNIQYEIIVLFQLQKPFIKTHNQPKYWKLYSKRQWRPSWISDNKGLRSWWFQITKMTSNINSLSLKPYKPFIEQHYKPKLLKFYSKWPTAAILKLDSR